MRPIGNITIRGNCRWTDQEIPHSEISPKSWPLAVKSLAQSLDYRANSYHIYLNTLGFHRCGKEISEICPCPFCPINTSFSGTPPSCHSTAQNPLSRRRHHPRTPRTSTKAFFTNFSSLRSSSRKKMAINFTVPEVSSLPFFSTPLPYSCSSTISFIEYSFFLFCSFFYPQTFRIWPIRSLFLAINLTSNVLAR